MSEIQELGPHDNHLGCIKTVTGKIINLRKPVPLAIGIRDIAAGLSKICRFAGQIPEFYSVAQHSVLVAAMAPAGLTGEALLHDASEAYLGDVTTPLKNILGNAYRDLERGFEAAIRLRFERVMSVNPSAKREIKKLDILAYELEDEAFRRGKKRRLRYFYEKYDLLNTPDQLGWPPYMAETIFMAAYNKL